MPTMESFGSRAVDIDSHIHEAAQNEKAEKTKNSYSVSAKKDC